MTPIRFGTSGWRAVLAEEFTFGNARRVIAAIARVLAQDGRKGELVLIGYDTRFLAERFADEAARILAAEGFRAEVSARPVPTPVLAFEIVRRRAAGARSEEHTSELQSRLHLVCRLLLEKKK